MEIIRMGSRGQASIIGIIYLVIGMILAATRGYFGHLTSVSAVLSALLAILLWPLLLFGVNLNINLGF